METLESLARRGSTVRELGAVVHTMKVLAKTTMRQAEQAADALRDYAHAVELGFIAALHDADGVPPRPGDPSAGGVIVIGSEQGLCGRFNERVVAYALASLTRDDSGRERPLLALGARVADELDSRGRPAAQALPLPGAVDGISASVRQLLLQIDAWRGRAEVGKVTLFVNRKPARGGADDAPYRPHRLILLPVDLGRFHRSRRPPPWPGRGRPGYSVGRARLLATLLQQHIFITLFHACAESMACEQAARLAAMQRAGDNIERHLQTLDGEYRQRRQSEITGELLDLFAGYEALR